MNSGIDEGRSSVRLTWRDVSPADSPIDLRLSSPHYHPHLIKRRHVKRRSGTSHRMWGVVILTEFPRGASAPRKFFCSVKFEDLKIVSFQLQSRRRLEDEYQGWGENPEGEHLRRHRDGSQGDLGQEGGLPPVCDRIRGGLGQRVAFSVPLLQERRW